MHSPGIERTASTRSTLAPSPGSTFGENTTLMSIPRSPRCSTVSLAG